MARTRATDYDDKRRAILDRSAELFAEHGYDRASMSKIAEACGVSKANLYHYYKDKEELLFDVIRFHLEELLEVVEAADNRTSRPEARLQELVAPCSKPIATPMHSTAYRSAACASCPTSARPS